MASKEKNKESSVRRQSLQMKKVMIAEEHSSFLPPMELYEELNKPLQKEEFDELQKLTMSGKTTMAMERMVEETNRHLQVGQLAEIQFTTEIALGLTSSLIVPTTTIQ